MIRIMLTASLLMFSPACFAYTVTGSVIDDTNTPIQGAVVGIEERSIVTETDSAGRFLFPQVAPGTYTLVCSHPSSGTHRQNIRVKRDFHFDWVIHAAPYQAGTTTIPIQGSSASDGTCSITRDDIKRYPLRGFGDSLHLLQTLPGIGGGFSLATVPIIRGTNPLFNRYYVDDIPVDNPYHYFGALIPIASALHEEAIERVDVIKGNAQASCTNSLGNVISIRSAEPAGEQAQGKDHP